MKPRDIRFRLVEALRLAAISAARTGSDVRVVEVEDEGTVRTVLRVAPETALELADEYERRYAS